MLAGSGVVLVPGQAAEAAHVSEADVRSAARVADADLSDDRIRVLTPVVARNLELLQPLHELEIDDAVAPATVFAPR